jgi:hypothetical protein
MLTRLEELIVIAGETFVQGEVFGQPIPVAVTSLSRLLRLDSEVVPRGEWPEHMLQLPRLRYLTTMVNFDDAPERPGRHVVQALRDRGVEVKCDMIRCHFHYSDFSTRETVGF